MWHPSLAVISDFIIPTILLLRALKCLQKAARRSKHKYEEENSQVKLIVSPRMLEIASVGVLLLWIPKLDGMRYLGFRIREVTVWKKQVIGRSGRVLSPNLRGSNLYSFFGSVPEDGVCSLKLKDPMLAKLQGWNVERKVEVLSATTSIKKSRNGNTPRSYLRSYTVTETCLDPHMLVIDIISSPIISQGPVNIAQAAYQYNISLSPFKDAKIHNINYINNTGLIYEYSVNWEPIIGNLTYVTHLYTSGNRVYGRMYATYVQERIYPFLIEQISSKDVFDSKKIFKNYLTKEFSRSDKYAPHKEYRLFLNTKQSVAEMILWSILTITFSIDAMSNKFKNIS